MSIVRRILWIAFAVVLYIFIGRYAGLHSYEHSCAGSPAARHNSAMLVAAFWPILVPVTLVIDAIPCPKATDQE